MPLRCTPQFLRLSSVRALNAKRVDTTRRTYSSIVPLTIVPFTAGNFLPGCLFAQAKPRNQLLVAIRGLIAEISQVPPALADQLQQPAPG